MKIIIQGFDSVETIDISTARFTRSRNGQVFWKGSEQWLCTGAVIYNNFGQVTDRLTVKELYDTLKNDKKSLYHKNGKPKFAITDLDHGTRRIWSNPAIKSHNIHVSE